MTLLALGLAVNLPEGRLHTILDGLVRSGQVRRRGAPASAIPGPRTAHYHLTGGRHSALPGPAPRRPVTEHPHHSTAGRPSPAPAPRRVPPSADLRTTRTQAI